MGPAGGDSLAFTYCQVPVCYRLGDLPSIRLERRAGGRETVAGVELGIEASAAIFGRRGIYRRVIVTVPPGNLLPDPPGRAT